MQKKKNPFIGRNWGYIQKRYKFTHIDEMNIKTINPMNKVFSKYFLNRRKPFCGMTLSRLNSKNPLINALDRGTSHPLVRNISHIPF